MSHAPKDARLRRWGSDDTGADILHVDMDSFFASVERVLHPELADKPLIVGGSGHRGVVTSATYEVRACQVHAGMPMARARALCPHAIVVPSSREAYVEFSHRIMEMMSEVTDAVEQVSIDEAFLNVAGAHRRLGSSLQIAQMIRSQIRQQVGVPASVGIAATKSVAKIASSNAKPDGVLLVSPDHTIEFLHGLPVGALWGVGASTRSTLEQFGVETVGDLAHLNMARLTKALGSVAAHHLHDLAWGIDHSRVTPGRKEKSIGMERTFDTNVVDRHFLEQFLTKASYDCARRLRAAHMVAFTVTIKIRDADFHTITRSQTAAVPTDVGRQIARIARTLFDRQPIPEGGIRLFGVRTDNLQSRDVGVPVTFDDDARPLAVERAMDRAVTRFGVGAVLPARALEKPSGGFVSNKIVS